ncbi:MAG: GTPase ObgE [Planctomycetota bacterium]
MPDRTVDRRGSWLYRRPVFVDQAVIFVRAGKGGDGCASFRREKFVPKGGPDGGDGGRGGSVIAVVDDNINTLMDFRFRRHWRAKSGEQGRGSSCFGADASDVVVPVPPGTVIVDDETSEVIADLGPGERVVLARGGAGGLGNEHFKSATNQTPEQCTPGDVGEEKVIRLELKLIADVGLLGKPNAGKSTLLSAVTAARPKIADYPFTTLSPQLGIAELDAARRIVIADIPGLIEGAADGVGLGHDFLRHVERTRLLVHLIELEPADQSSFAENYRAIRAELEAYAPELAEKPELIAVSKVDLLGGDAGEEAEAAGAIVRAELQLGHDVPVFCISSANGHGLGPLLEACWARLGKAIETWKEREALPAPPHARG